MASDKAVIVRPMGGKSVPVYISSYASVRDVLAKAGIKSTREMKVMADDNEVSLGQRIGTIQELVVVPAVKGGINFCLF